MSASPPNERTSAGGPDMSEMCRYCCKSRWSAALLNPCCAFVPDLESIFRDEMLKILLQQYLPFPDLRSRSKERHYSICSSARSRNDSGIVSPRALAVLILMISSN